MDVKRCSKCGETKPVNMFAGNGRQKDGFHHSCQICIAEQHAAKAAKQKAHRDANIDAFRAAGLAYIKANPERNREAVRAWREANPEKARMQRRASYAANPEMQLIRNHTRRALIKKNGGSFTREEIKALLEAQNYQCAYCKRLVKLTIDHIIPLSKGGINDISNICWACRRCNFTKHARTPEQWIKRWYSEEQNRR